MGEPRIRRDEVIDVLRQVQDPELERNIVSLGMVKNVEIREQEVVITLEIASDQPQLHATLRHEVEDALRRLSPEIKPVVEVRRPRGAIVPPAAQSIPGVEHAIAIASGKGGVGKSTVAVNLACALQSEGWRVGLMDGDIYGPNLPLMLGIDPQTRPTVTAEGKMSPLEALGIKMISMGVLVPPDQPMIWRGPMLHSAVQQFLQKVDWGTLDFLLVDLPPGTGDVQLSLVQTVPLSGAVMVTTPQEVALLDVRKGIMMFRKTGVSILGIVENMTGEVFGEGGGRQAAEQYGVPFLGSIPLDAQVRQGGDRGRPLVVEHPESKTARCFIRAASKLEESVSQAKASL